MVKKVVLTESSGSDQEGQGRDSDQDYDVAP